MSNTYQILLNWDKGQPFSERMSAKILANEGYKEIDPQSPTGGADGTKDILCKKGGKKYVAACYFPNGQKTYAEIKKKFDDDILGVSKNNAAGFIFITNQKITPGERISLMTGYKSEIQIYHGEMVIGALDSPKGYGIRLEYLDIPVSKEEQMSFLNTHLDLKEQFEELKVSLLELKKVTTAIANNIHKRDIGYEPLTGSLPIAGIQFSSRLSIEDLLALHKIVMQEDQGDYHANLGFRKVDVWIGKPGADKHSADFVPESPEGIPSKVYELLKWWREEYAKNIFGNEQQKISVIASFHEKFLTIHPFLDGNGRVARVIASLQYKDLLNRDVKFEPIDRAQYYRAIQAAIEGNSEALNDIFLALIKV